MAFHECAGNPLNPNVPQRRVGNVEWTGVRLADLLRLVNVKDEARFVISKGIDQGVYNKVYYSGYEKDLPLEKALDPNVLIALAINNEPITVERGGPVRLVVPGYYGTNSTKWLTQLVVSDVRSTSDFTTKYYMDRELVDGQIKGISSLGCEPELIDCASQKRAIDQTGRDRDLGMGMGRITDFLGRGIY